MKKETKASLGIHLTSTQFFRSLQLSIFVRINSVLLIISLYYTYIYIYYIHIFDEY